MQPYGVRIKSERHPSPGCPSNLSSIEEALPYSNECEEESQPPRGEPMTPVIIPNPLESDTQYYRYHHFDIPGAELSDLQDELYALRPLLWGLPKDGWLRERVRLIEAELAKRRYNAKPERGR
jgi:hypothetical protein